jgi:hypothetical protein
MCLITRDNKYSSAIQKNIVRTENIVKINFLSPGVSYEHAVNKDQTIFSEIYLGLGLKQTNNIGSPNGTEIDVALLPGFNFQYRYYYNYGKRKNNDKRTEKNSMNYIAPAINYILSNKKLRSNSLSSFGLLWGLQRNYPGHFSLDLNLGFGYRVEGSKYYVPSSDTKANLGGLGKFTLGFWLNAKKEKQ